MRVRTNHQLHNVGPVNRYLLCAVLAKQTRRLGKMIPEMRVAELIGVALRNCTEHLVGIQMDQNTPDVIREEAAQMFPLTELPEACLVSSLAPLDRSQAESEASANEKGEGGECGSNEDGSNVPVDVFVGDGVRIPDSCTHIASFPRYPMSNANGNDRMRQLQLQALAENLYAFANHHCENGNYIVAYALYGRAVEAALGIDAPQHKKKGSALVAKIRKEQQAVFDLLRWGETGSRNASLENARKAIQ